MKVRIGINGLGRIGRCVVRALYEEKKYNEQIEIVTINASRTATQHAHLIKYDSVHGKFNGDIVPNDSEKSISIIGNKFNLVNERDPAKIPWNNVDIVFETTGKFTKRDKAAKHNAKKIIVSGPVPDADVTIVYGVNNDMLKPEHKVISAASCTTNCLAPIVKVLHSNFGIKSGFMTTVHAYTNDQNVLDGNHRDPRRGRTCGVSMVPTTTGAAKTIGKVISELNGKLDGVSIRVPVPNVSLLDFKFTTEKKATIEAINDALQKAACQGDEKPHCTNMTSVLAVCKEPLVSVDFTHNPHSAIVDLSGTYVRGEICRVAAWYDNEWGFSQRMLDVALLWSKIN